MDVLTSFLPSPSTRAQLEQWDERLAGRFPEAGVRVYVLAKQSAKAPTLLVPKAAAPSRALLKPEAVLLVHTKGRLTVWTGRAHKFNFVTSAKKLAQLLDFATLTVEVVAQGKESATFSQLFV